MATACGGGGGEPTTSVIGDPTPVASTPTPTPSDLSGPLGLTQLSDFPTLGFAYRYTSNSDGSQRQGPSTPDPTEVISFSYSAADQTYEIKIPGLERGRLALVNGNARYSTHSLATSPSRTFQVVLYRPGAANPEFPLEYTSFGWWEDPIYTPIPATPRSNNTGYFAYGVPTALGDVPVTGSATYHSLVTGATSASLGASYVSGAANLTFDFSKGTLAGGLELVLDAGPGERFFGDFEFTATSYTVGANGFSGKLSIPGSTEEGFFEGQFTGPQASELMVRWVLPQSVPEVGRTGSLFGVLVGKHQND
jgi:hypothetical protein